MFESIKKIYRAGYATFGLVGSIIFLFLTIVSFFQDNSLEKEDLVLNKIIYNNIDHNIVNEDYNISKLRIKTENKYFFIRQKKYFNDSLIEKLNIGDTIDVYIRNKDSREIVLLDKRSKNIYKLIESSTTKLMLFFLSFIVFLFIFIWSVKYKR